eukprot:TRINITY_DN2435_c0_g1_i1.p1 TRINITY_DN2435_c0_g1~~TRINITY_DN2435_c0_g1_i1.p1  ORF type:complete len:1107 (-),score=210.86 TRINITY_DN2435_c0_g1_i1:21-3341(-)
MQKDNTPAAKPAGSNTSSTEAKESTPTPKAKGGAAASTVNDNKFSIDAHNAAAKKAASDASDVALSALPKELQHEAKQSARMSPQVRQNWFRVVHKLRQVHKKEHDVSSFFFPSRLRVDSWTELKHICQETILQTDIERFNGKVDSDLHQEIEVRLSRLENIEAFWGFPGIIVFNSLLTMFKEFKYHRFATSLVNIASAVANESYRSKHTQVTSENLTCVTDDGNTEGEESYLPDQPRQGYFEVMIVTKDDNVQRLPDALHSRMRRTEDPFHYEIFVVKSFEEALCGIMFNSTIQSVVIRNNFDMRSDGAIHDAVLPFLEKYQTELGKVDKKLVEERQNKTLLLAAMLKDIRPEVDIFAFSDLPVEHIAMMRNNDFRRVFYNQNGDIQELHLSILQGVKERFDTPFFSALIEYARHPMGVFHALPISRGSSLFHSHWIKDMLQFYGRNIFLAETSATTGGLDSLLEPTGAIKTAQTLAARTFGSEATFWVTNGTSTANKIVVQGLIRPGDIVLVDRNCHKSHHLGLALIGASVVYLEAYPLPQYAIYGGVPLKSIKQQLLDFKKAGTLHLVKLLLLTNCTFDGIVYNVQKVMEECLAIKPDLVFLWDEAWWGFARFHPLLRRRTAMYSAHELKTRFSSEAYKIEYKEWKKSHSVNDAGQRWMPDPEKVRIRVYSTQSTHKTLTALRQGSMIHVHDQDFKRLVERPFIESFFTHTSTSPNYQILASLDVGRRQVALEGFELVQKHLEKALVIRQEVDGSKEISKYFHFLDVGEIIPAEFRQESKLESYIKDGEGPQSLWQRINYAWSHDEFCLDPNRLTLHTGRAGIDGNTFKNKYLMDKFQIQVNKTSINSVLFMLTIGTTRSAVAYLLEALTKISELVEVHTDELSAAELRVHKKKIYELTEHLPPLPNFSSFHERYRRSNVTPEGVLREPFFDAYEENDCDYIPLNDRLMDDVEKSETPLVSADFVIPYPPGFPILVPGQVVTQDVIDFFRHLDVKEVHGYTPSLGLRIFKPYVLTAEDIYLGTSSSETLALARARRQRAGEAIEKTKNAEGKQELARLREEVQTGTSGPLTPVTAPLQRLGGLSATDGTSFQGNPLVGQEGGQ